MHRFIYLLLSILFLQTVVFAGYNELYIADIQYDWINKTTLEKEEVIKEVHDIIFANGTLSKQNSLKGQFKDKLQDKDYREHYYAASAGYKEYKDYNISAFYYKKQKHIYMYALQSKKDVTKSYYYDALGNLKYIDYNYGEYPEYPYYTFQYSISGKPISAIYNVSKDNQYLYSPDGTFIGVWYKHNLYDKHSKVILTRTTY